MTNHPINIAPIDNYPELTDPAAILYPTLLCHLNSTEPQNPFTASAAPSSCETKAQKPGDSVS